MTFAPGVRAATPSDLTVIRELIMELAQFERAADEVMITDEQLCDGLFGAVPAAGCLIAEHDQQPVGMALHFTQFSTWTGRGLYLEDLYVRPSARGSGLGTALLISLAGLAVEQGCARFEWSVLDWNTPAIGFYQSLGAEPLDEWTRYRLTGPALRDLADRSMIS